MPEQIKVRLNYLADLLDLEQAARLGDILPPESARVIEKALHLNKIDLVNRARLLGFYKWRTQNRRAKNYKLFEENSIKHILWFIKNVPGCAFCSDDYFALKSSASPYYKKVANAWRTAIRENADMRDQTLEIQSPEHTSAYPIFVVERSHKRQEEDVD